MGFILSSNLPKKVGILHNGATNNTIDSTDNYLQVTRGKKENRVRNGEKIKSWPRWFGIPDRVVLEGEVIEVTLHVIDHTIFVQEQRFFWVTGVHTKRYGFVSGIERSRQRLIQNRVGDNMGLSRGTRWWMGEHGEGKRQHQQRECPHFKRWIQLLSANCYTLSL